MASSQKSCFMRDENVLKASFCTENLSWNWLTTYPAKSRQIRICRGGVVPFAFRPPGFMLMRPVGLCVQAAIHPYVSKLPTDV